MRSAAFLILILAFAMAVVLPNDIGTDDMPARPAKQVVVKAGHHFVKPVRGGPTAWLVAIQRQDMLSLAGDCPAVVCRSGQTVANVQLSFPLVI
ncbi:MAG TPA: hypothetical protein VKU82_03140 [Planctomycetaceae bacterium]|nr:hypothetical protein [Planctomycetaceae bacterium]